VGRAVSVIDPLDRRGDVADLPGRQLLDRPHVRAEDADLLHVVRAAVRHQQDARARTHAAVGEAHVDDHALIGVVERVEDECFERRVGVALRRGHPGDDRFEHLRHAGSVLGRDRERLAAVEIERLGDLIPRGLDVGGR